jgi:hypothetical protein
MPTAMEYAIDTIVKLCNDNAKLRYLAMSVSPPSENGESVVVINENLVEEEFVSASELQRLKESADLIAEAQEKRIVLGEANYKQKLEERDAEIAAVKVQNDFLTSQLKELTAAMMDTKLQLNKCVGSNAGYAVAGRPRKPTHSPHSTLVNYLVSEVYEHPHGTNEAKPL